VIFWSFDQIFGKKYFRQKNPTRSYFIVNLNNPFSNRNLSQLPAALNCSEKSVTKKGTAGSSSGGGKDDQMKVELADSD
jgi:hypothetical protein